MKREYNSVNDHKLPSFKICPLLKTIPKTTPFLVFRISFSFLDADMAKKLVIRAIQRGIGSMDFIDMLLIMGDPDESSIAPFAIPLNASELAPSSSGSSVIQPTPPLALNPVGATASLRPTSSLENSP